MVAGLGEQGKWRGIQRRLREIMALRSGLKAALLAASVFGLAACGGEEAPDVAAFDAEVQQLVDSGDLYGELFVYLKEQRPELYDKFRKISLRAYGSGRSAKQSSYLASSRMRQSFVDELLNLSKAVSDEHAKDIIALNMDYFKYLNEQDARDCWNVMQGLHPEHVEEFPKELQKREVQLMVDIMKAPKTAENRRAASPNEVLNWVSNVQKLEPSIEESFMLRTEDKIGKKEAKVICNGHEMLLKRLSHRKPETRGTLLRGMALMSLRERAINRPSEDDEAKS